MTLTRHAKQDQVSLKKQPISERPKVCPKPGCGGLVFIAHEDGWQCFNCMKIIYDERPLPLVTARPIKVGRYRRSS